jgi:hypothetical protein
VARLAPIRVQEGVNRPFANDSRDTLRGRCSKEETFMRFAVALVIVLLGLPAFAQHKSHQHHKQGDSPYADLRGRSIKALSEQQIADLKNGKGMGLALAAELNGYPGPLHVLELGDALSLSASQRADVQRLYDAMKSEAVAVGEQLIAAEHALDQQFAARMINPEQLNKITQEIGQAQGELRSVHLKYHLTTTALLSPAQKQRYAQLRGYH